MPTGQLRRDGWAKLTQDYPDPNVITAVLGICTFSARIGYEGYRSKTTIHSNLKSAIAEASIVSADIVSELNQSRLEVYSGPNNLPRHFTASPLGLTDKADGSKRRIHYPSYPPRDISGINAGIPEHYGAIKYSGIEDAIQAVHRFGDNSILIKRDFKSAFSHIPVSPIDTPLLGFQWEGIFYAECFLPFGLRTARYLFNLFAEVFHWILEQQLKMANISASIIHYLDDFLLVLDPGAITNLEQSSQIFTSLCVQVGLSIKTSKNEEGTAVSFAGLVLDTGKMVIRLPDKKRQKPQKMISEARHSRSLSLLDIQKITGYLNFVFTVLPLGRAFLRRLYNMELYFPPQALAATYHKRRISGEAHKDLAWWSEVLQHSPERSIAPRSWDFSLEPGLTPLVLKD